MEQAKIKRARIPAQRIDGAGWDTNRRVNPRAAKSIFLRRGIPVGCPPRGIVNELNRISVGVGLGEYGFLEPLLVDVVDFFPEVPASRGTVPSLELIAKK